MTKSNVVTCLPEFVDVDETEFNALITSALAVFPADEYVDENLAKVYFVAQFYYESIKRMKAMDNIGTASEKIDDIAVVFKDSLSEKNPYSEMYESMKVTVDCDVQIGFMSCR